MKHRMMREEDNRIIFRIRPDGTVDYQDILSTSGLMHVDLEEIAQKAKVYIESLLEGRIRRLA